MTLEIRATGHTVPEKVRQYAERKASRLAKLFGDVQHMELSAALERGLYVVEFTVEGDSVLLRSQERNDDLRAGINGVMDKVERQAVKYKGRVRDDRRRPQAEKLSEAGEEAELEIEDEEPFAPVIARRKRYAMKPMSVDEAARQMELVSHTFFLFRNEESGEICALYRRHDGTYGLIEPDV